MIVGKVIGNVVCTPKHPALTGIRLLLIRKYVSGRPAGIVVAGDSLQTAGPDDYVYLVDSSEAAASFRRGKVPVDLAVVGIIDRYNSTKCTLTSKIQRRHDLWKRKHWDSLRPEDSSARWRQRMPWSKRQTFA